MDQPQFATVTFVSEQDGSLSSTFRVPLRPETSVRHLAKEAMQRLVLSRFSSSASGKTLPAISVSEVRVGGMEPHHAEVFARDLVTQVVLVKEEVLFMRLQLAPPEGARRDAHSRAPAPLAPRTEDMEVAAPATATRAPSPAAQVTTRSPAALEERAVNVPATRPTLRKEAQPLRKRPRQDMTAATNAAPSAAAEKEKPRPVGWGPEAHKSFPENYVSSPDRLAREIRKRQREEERRRKAADGTAAAPRVPPPPVAEKPKRVARQLEYEEDGRRATVGHHVDSALVVEDEPTAEEEGSTTAAPLPKGWGSEAFKYFDPDTYCDDPRKAKVSIADRPRATRPHRTPPSAPS